MTPRKYAIVKTDATGFCLVQFIGTSVVGADTTKPLTNLRVQWWKKSTTPGKQKKGFATKWVPWLVGGAQSATAVARGAVVVANAGIIASSKTTGPLASQFIQLKAATASLLNNHIEKGDEDDKEDDESAGDNGDWD
jgi:hypothetical protein